MLVVVALFVAFAVSRGRASRSAPPTASDSSSSLGCMRMIVVQAFVNIGVVTSSWPVTGVPLPFISFGGSSLVVSLVAVALVVNVGRFRRSPGA